MRNNEETVLKLFHRTDLLTPRISYKSSEGDAEAIEKEIIAMTTRIASKHWAREKIDDMETERKLSEEKNIWKKGRIKSNSGAVGEAAE